MKYTPLSNEDRLWLQVLDGEIWRRSKDRYGHIHSFPIDSKVPLEAEILDRIKKLISDHCLPLVLHTGPYAELSITVYDHNDAGIPPDRVISLDEQHLGFTGTTFKTWHKTFVGMSKFTHTNENRQVCAFYKLPLPGEEQRYAY
jgi:hypothetical protein